MKDILKNRKGFTLIELLAVIVILAVLMLLATPAVLTIMTNARKNAFKTEAMSFIDAAKTAYAAELTTTAGNTNVCYKLGGNDATINQYIDKNLSGYSGYVTVAPSTDGASTYTIVVSNGTYKIENAGNNVAATSANYDSWSVDTGASVATAPSGVTCK